MPTLSIDGYEIRFPFDPYAAQVRYMKSVLQALDSGSNALLESPTGTGKTMCLLCATLAWVLAKRRCVPRHPQGDRLANRTDLEQVDRYRILYCSRTHAQLTQVIRELKRALRSNGRPPARGCSEAGAAAEAEAEVEAEAERAWSEVTMALLGSREHMCVNSEVSRLPSSHAQQSMCNSLRADRGCRFFVRLQMNEAEGCLPTNDEGDVVYDMEDLVREGRRNGFCPYYLERDLAKGADIVFMPYNYILDAHLRTQLPFELSKQCIIVVDEAHNVPSVLSASACLTLEPLELANAIHDCSRAISMQRLAIEKESGDVQREILLGEEFASLKLLLARLEGCIVREEGDAPVEAEEGAARLAATDPRGPSQGMMMVGELVCPGAYMERFLKRALITREMYEGTARSSGMSSTIDNAIAVLMDSEKPAAGLGAVQRFLSAVFSSPIDESTRFILKDEDISAAGARGLPPRGGKVPPPTPPPPLARDARRRSLGFWRLDNSADMTELSNQVRCLLLTSGTLSPLDHLAAELGAPFPVRLRGRHVIGAGQVLGSVLCRGPTGGRLNGGYAFRSSVEYHVALGMTLLNVSRVTPGGTLVFFPSYAALHSSTDLWRAGTGRAGESKTIWGLLSELKPVFVEPAGSGDLTPVVAGFQEAVRQSPRRGAILLAVCRGKVSEGIDFADNDGRCVMVTGVPFANHTDLFVRLKREYLTAVAPRRPRVNGALFTGDSWYRNEAMRAVNQSIGRVIRHKDDYGAVVLADERFVDLAEKDCLSEWIASRTVVHRDFRACYPALAAFFLQHVPKGGGEAAGGGGGVRLGHDTDEGQPACHYTGPLTRQGEGSRGDASANAVPASAELAKQYALKREQEINRDASERQRRRLEEAEETPRLSHVTVLRGIPTGPMPSSREQENHGGADATPVDVAATCVPPMQKQTLSSSLTVAGASVVSSPPPGATVAALCVGGLTSKQLCALLKERVTAATYDRFKAALRGLAQCSRGVQGSANGEVGGNRGEMKVREQLNTAVDALWAVFTEAAPANVSDLFREVGRHIPEELRPLYTHAIRERLRR